jgi:glycosyltransferase involved in cell wall biosynthesis
MTFSIVTVVRNDKIGLEKTVESLRKQTYPHIEHIVVDGASTDTTVDFIKNNLDRINKWKSEPDSGIYDAMNKGKNMATGDYIVFINAGDVFFTDTVLQDIYNGMDEDKTKLYYGKVTIFNQDVSWEFKPHNDIDTAPFLPHHQAAFYPRHFYKKEDYDIRFRLVADIDFTLRSSLTLKKTYIPIKTIHSELTGFSMNLHSSIKGSRIYIKDYQLFASKYPAMSADFSNFNLYSKALVKYILFKIGGSYLVAKMIARRFQITKTPIYDVREKK